MDFYDFLWISMFFSGFSMIFYGLTPSRLNFDFFGVGFPTKND